MTRDRLQVGLLVTGIVVGLVLMYAVDSLLLFIPVSCGVVLGEYRRQNSSGARRRRAARLGRPDKAAVPELLRARRARRSDAGRPKP